MTKLKDFDLFTKKNRKKLDEAWLRLARIPFGKGYSCYPLIARCTKCKSPWSTNGAPWEKTYLKFKNKKPSLIVDIIKKSKCPNCGCTLEPYTSKTPSLQYDYHMTDDNTGESWEITFAGRNPFLKSKKFIVEFRHRHHPLKHKRIYVQIPIEVKP